MGPCETVRSRAAIVTGFVLVEKILPFGDHGGRMAGLAMIAAAGFFRARTCLQSC